MSNLLELEKEALSLSQSEREYLALAIWDSLSSAEDIDPEGIDIALCRDQEIESGQVRPITHSEFLKQTADKP